MLSNIGRAAIRRVSAAKSCVSASRAVKSIWSQRRVDSSNRPQLSFLSQRLFATATKATQTKTSRAKSVTPPKVKVKKASPKKAVKKPVAKKKPKKKVTKLKSKPKAKAKPKKAITPEQKTKADIKILKTKALSPPTGKPSSAWGVLVSELGAEHAGSGTSLPSFVKEAAAKYKSLSPQQLEEYNHTANQNKEANLIALKQWTESHTPEVIRLANNARLLLKRKTGKPNSFPPLKDTRIPKRASTAYSLFSADRWATGDFKGLKIVDTAPILHKEFRALSDVDRKFYEDRAETDKQRYIQEFKTVFNRDPGFVKHAATT